MFFSFNNIFIFHLTNYIAKKKSKYSSIESLNFFPFKFSQRQDKKWKEGMRWDEFMETFAIANKWGRYWEHGNEKDETFKENDYENDDDDDDDEM